MRCSRTAPRSRCCTCTATGVASTIWRSSAMRWTSRMATRRTGRPAPGTAATMIEARDFVEAARERGFHWYAGVPCSYLTPFINYVLQDESLHYVSMANEGDAVALIAGVALSAGSGAAHRRGVSMMQNSGLGNAVS